MNHNFFSVKNPGPQLPGFFVFILLFAFNGLAQSKAASRIDDLISRKSYFEARAVFQSQKKDLTTIETLRFGAFIDNAFNELEASNEKIVLLQQQYKKQLPDSTRFRLLELQQSNYVKLYNYSAAAICIEELITEFPQFLSPEALADFRNTQSIWAALETVPVQEVIIRERTVLKLGRDAANLPNLDLRQDSVHIGFIFDTGANISTVTETTARRLHMLMKDASIEVNSITGIKIRSKLAVCPEFTLGSIVVRNAVFLVFPDSALAVPQIGYQINGIIGFPVIEAMKEIQITRSGEFIVPAQRQKTTESNMALDFLNPIVQLNNEIYTFDSGAANTMLYKLYYDKHCRSVEKRNREKTLQYGGAGGNISRQGYVITWQPEISGRKLKIKDVMVFKDTSREHESLFYGNIGQDVVQQFDKMTLNFESMFIRFE